MFIDKLGDIVEYSNTYHSKIKMNSVDVKSSTYIDFNVGNNNKDLNFVILKLNFDVDDHVRISKCKNNFAKGYARSWSEEILMIKKFKNTVPWSYVIEDLNGEIIVGSFTKRNCKRQIKQSWKVAKKKSDKLYVK